MATVTGYTAEHMDEIANTCIVDGSVVGDDLILIQRDSTEINAGSVRGLEGPAGASSIVVVTNATRPTGGALFQGLVIYETDTKRYFSYDGVKWVFVGGLAPTFLGTKTANQSIPNNVITDITWVETGGLDLGNIHSASNATITIPAEFGGLWDMGTWINWGVDADGNRDIYLVQNASTILAARQEPVASGPNQMLSAIWNIPAGDTVKVYVSHSAGNALNVTSTSRFWARYLGPSS